MTNEVFKAKLSKAIRNLFIIAFICVSILAFVWSPFFTYTEEGNTQGIFINLGFSSYTIFIEEEVKKE